MRSRIEQLQRDLDRVAMVHEEQRKLFRALGAKKGHLKNWTAEEIEAAELRMKKVVERTESHRAKLEARLVEALAELNTPKCIRCQLTPVEDEIPLCERCAEACGHEAAEQMI